MLSCGGGQGGGSLGEVRGREGKGQEAGFPRWWEPGEKRKILQYCITFYNINRTKRREPLRKGAGSGSKRYGRREFQTPPVSTHSVPKPKQDFPDNLFEPVLIANPYLKTISMAVSFCGISTTYSKQLRLKFA